MLAALILVCLLAAAVSALAVKGQRLPGWLGVVIVTVLPLPAWLALQISAEPARSPLQFEVLGQYHRLADTLRIAAGADADVVLGAASSAEVSVAFDAAAARLRVDVLRGGGPVLLGDHPVNALAVGRRAVVRSAGDSLVVVRPWLCFRCDTRYIEAGGSRREVRLTASPRIGVGTDTITLVTIGGRAYAAAAPHSAVTVDGDSIPSTLTGAPDTLMIGWPDGEKLLITPVAAAHRLEVRFEDRRRARWVLPQADDSLVLMVSATAAEPVPATMPVLNPAAAAPGAAREPYGGLLRLHDGSWSFLRDGRSRALELDRAQLLPGPEPDRRAGHLVQIRRYDMDHAGARWAVVVAWLLGAFSLAWTFRHMHPDVLATRVALLGGVFTLAAVRATLAFRVWLAPPHDSSSPQTLLALLIAAPALIALLHLWSRAGESRNAVALRNDAIAALLPPAGALAAVLVLVLPAWRGPILETVFATVVIGTVGVALLNRLLLGAPAADERRPRHPLAAVSTPALEGYTYRQFLAALVLLAVLGFMLVVLMELLRYGALLATAGWGLILIAALVTVARPDVLIRRRSPVRPIVTAIAAGLASGGVAWALRFGPVVTVVALSVGAVVAWLIARSASFSVRPVRLRALLALPLSIAVLASLAAVLMPGVVGALRVTAEYALALAGLIAIARIFAILWFRHMQRLSRSAHARTRSALPGAVAVAGVVLLLVTAVYVPLVLFDQGLVLLFLAATVTAIAVGFHAMGARWLATLVPIVIASTFVLGMFVRPAALEDGSASPSTAQIRYAATYHPRELQRHMLTSPDAQPVTTVRTLQQYWGIGHFAAGGTVGRGYFDGGYADWIVPRPVALTENAFSTFLLSEHGWYGGLAVLLCYLVIALALLYGAIRTTDRPASAPRALLLIGIAAFWIVPALYIAGANGLLLPLTGQNMPMLGLLSRADVALACWLTAFGLCALPAAGGSGLEHVPTAGWTARLRRGTLVTGGVFSAATLALIVLLWKPTHAEPRDFALDGVIEDIETLVEQGAIQVAAVRDGRDSLIIAPSAAAHPLLAGGDFVRTRVQRANALARGEPGGAGCLDADALLRVRDDGGIAVFNALCSIRAAPRSSYAWSGALATTAPTPRFAIGDGRIAALLDPAHEDVVSLGSCTAAGVHTGRAVRIGCNDAAPVVQLGTTAPVLESSSPDLLLNGLAAETPTLLRHGDHLRASGVDLVVNELPGSALGYARWENATTRRIVHAQGAPWIAQLDTLLARGMADAERAEWRAELTLSPGLHTSLVRRLTEACAGVPRVRRCSALLADPLTGAVLAVASTASQPHRYLPSDANLRNHPAASAIKPILAAAALHAYPQLRTLEVEHDAAEYTIVANTGVQPSLRAPRSYPGARIPLRGYLGASDNLYSATLGFLATSRRAPDGAPALRGQNNQSRLVLNGQPLRGEPSWSGAGSLDLSESPLADALRTLYGVHVDSDAVPAFERSFWESAIAAGALVPTGELQRITPEPVGLRMDSFRSPRELTSFTIGGDRNRWNNVSLVEAMSRIYSGRAVRLHLLARVGDQTLAYPAPEMTSFSARQEVLDGMAAVTQEPWGTAYALRNAFAPAVYWRAKTGTLREREWVGSVFLFAGGGQRDGVCPAAGVITIEMEDAANPDGVATNVFRDAVAPLLRSSMGWGGTRCARAAR